MKTKISQFEFTCSIYFNEFTRISYFFNIEPSTIFIDDETEVEVSSELIEQIFNA